MLNLLYDTTREQLPTLRFTEYAFAKLKFMLHRGGTEVGGWGICLSDDPLLVEDFLVLPQRSTSASVDWDGDTLANYAIDQAMLGRHPTQFHRVWIHTHPGSSPIPSWVDWNTFDKVILPMSWAVMFIISRTHDVYALMYYKQPKLLKCIPVEVVAGQPGSEWQAVAKWDQEYVQNVNPPQLSQTTYSVRERQLAAHHAALPQGEPTPFHDALAQAMFGAVTADRDPKVARVKLLALLEKHGLVEAPGLQLIEHNDLTDDLVALWGTQRTVTFEEEVEALHNVLLDFGGEPAELTCRTCVELFSRGMDAERFRVMVSEAHETSRVAAGNWPALDDLIGALEGYTSPECNIYRTALDLIPLTGPSVFEQLLMEHVEQT